jgi:Flp pilus assembly protein TadG
MRSRIRDDVGAITAEFAAVLPAVVLILACALGALQLSDEQLRLQGAVADAARLLGRGDSGAQAIVAGVAPGARLTIRSPGVLVCADASAPASLGLLVGLTVSASACALDDAQP